MRQVRTISGNSFLEVFVAQTRVAPIHRVSFCFQSDLFGSKNDFLCNGWFLYNRNSAYMTIRLGDFHYFIVIFDNWLILLREIQITKSIYGKKKYFILIKFIKYDYYIYSSCYEIAQWYFPSSAYFDTSTWYWHCHNWFETFQIFKTTIRITHDEII